MIGGIYIIRCLENNKIYVGSAKSLNDRWKQHLKNLEKQIHINKHLQRAYNKYGKESLIFEVFEQLGEYNKNYYFERENIAINFLNKEFKLFNQAPAGGGWSLVSKERLLEIRKNISKGIKKATSEMSQEHRNKIYGDHRRGIPLSEDHKRKTSEGLKGKLKSKETKIKMSIAQRGSDHCKENGKRVGKSNLGKVPHNSIPIEIDGVKYDSIKTAARHLNLNYYKLLKKLYPEKYRNKNDR